MTLFFSKVPLDVFPQLLTAVQNEQCSDSSLMPTSYFPYTPTIITYNVKKFSECIINIKSHAYEVTKSQSITLYILNQWLVLIVF